MLGIQRPYLHIKTTLNYGYLILTLIFKITLHVVLGQFTINIQQQTFWLAWAENSWQVKNVEIYILILIKLGFFE